MPLTAALQPAPAREVVQAEALSFLSQHPAPPHAAVITSLPDLSELPELGFEDWRGWFVDAVARVVAWTPADSVSIFFQSDVRHRGVWVDKGYLVLKGAEAAGASLVSHRIVCREPAGSVTSGRASYSHLICVARTLQPSFLAPGCDVLPEAGAMPYAKAMGVAACRAACEFVLQRTAARLVVDPFCGRGTVLAVANALGLDALGVDRSARICRVARRLSFDRDAI